MEPFSQIVLLYRKMEWLGKRRIFTEWKRGQDSFGLQHVKSFLCKEVTAVQSLFSSARDQGSHRGLWLHLNGEAGTGCHRNHRKVKSWNDLCWYVCARRSCIILVQFKFQTAEVLENTHLLIKLQCDLRRIARMEWMSFVIKVMTCAHMMWL